MSKSDGRGSPPGGSAAEGRRGKIDGLGLPQDGSAAEGRRGEIDKITRGGVTLWLVDTRKDESLLDYITRRTRNHGAMCPCDVCKFARVM